MCMSKPKPPAAQPPPPTPPPSPVILPEEIGGTLSETDRRKRLNNMRYGLSSTIKTKAGFSGGETAELVASGSGKKTLG